MIQVVFPIGFKGKARNLPGICLPLYASCGGLKNGRNAIIPGFGETRLFVGAALAAAFPRRGKTWIAVGETYGSRTLILTTLKGSNYFHASGCAEGAWGFTLKIGFSSMWCRLSAVDTIHNINNTLVSCGDAWHHSNILYVGATLAVAALQIIFMFRVPAQTVCPRIWRTPFVIASEAKQSLLLIINYRDCHKAFSLSQWHSWTDCLDIRLWAARFLRNRGSAGRSHPLSAGKTCQNKVLV